MAVLNDDPFLNNIKANRKTSIIGKVDHRGTNNTGIYRSSAGYIYLLVIPGFSNGHLSLVNLTSLLDGKLH